MDGHGDLAIRSKSDLSNPKIGLWEISPPNL